MIIELEEDDMRFSAYAACGVIGLNAVIWIWLLVQIVLVGRAGGLSASLMLVPVAMAFRSAGI